MPKSKEALIDWKIKGPNWTYKIQAPEDCDPMEIFTQCLEAVWADIESWKLDYIQGQSLGAVKTDNNEYPKLSVLLVLENSRMTTKEEHFVVSTPLALANAGLHNEAARLERKWNLIPEEERLKTILRILEDK
jgi:hypothetical protein